VARYTFEFVAPDGSIVITGTDVSELADDGRLQAITGFFGDVPADDAA
jgi:hypothetical protein